MEREDLLVPLDPLDPEYVRLINKPTLATFR